MSSPRLLEASFVLAHVNHRALVVPTSPNLATPDGRTWQEVTDAVLAEVPSKMLFALVGTQLQRDLKSYAIGRHGRWVFDRTLECDMKKLLIEAKTRYLSIRNGVFAKELYRALLALFKRDPRFRSLLSNQEKATSAAFHVTRRVLGQLYFHWEIVPFDGECDEAFSLRLVHELQEIVFERLARYPVDRDIMPAHRFIRYEFYLKKMGQYLGIDRQYDKLYAKFADACRLFPRDGTSLYGLRLDEFWSRMTCIGETIAKRLEVADDVLKEIALVNDESFGAKRVDSSVAVEPRPVPKMSFNCESMDLPFFV